MTIATPFNVVTRGHFLVMLLTKLSYEINVSFICTSISTLSVTAIAWLRDLYGFPGGRRKRCEHALTVDCRRGE